MITWVVVPSHDGRSWLPALLASLDGQQRAPHGVVVVDDGSSDGTAAWLAGRHVEVIRHPVARGFAAAANAGIARARERGAEAVALVNQDIELAPDWIALTIAAFDSGPDVGAVATKMVVLGDRGVIDDAGDTLRRDGVCEQRGRGRADRGLWDHEQDVWGACAGAAVYRVAALDCVGGFDERYGMYLEDVDLALRLRLAGWRCRYVPAVALHAGAASGAPVPRLVARNTIVLVTRWFPLRWLPKVVYRQLSWLAAAVRGGWARSHLRGLADGLAAVPATLRARRVAGGVAYPEIAAAIPDRPWRGPGAGGHPEAAE